MDSDWEMELISLITQLLFEAEVGYDGYSNWNTMAVSSITQVISLVNAMDLNSQTKPVSELIPLITQAISLFDSMDLDSQTKLLLLEPELDTDLSEIYVKILTMEPEPELLSVIHKIFSLIFSLNSTSGTFISLCLLAQVRFENGNFHVIEDEDVQWSSHSKWECLFGKWVNIKITGEDATYFWCRGCNGKNHEEYKKAPVEIKHHFHPKHSLQLFLLDEDSSTMECYCCHDKIERVFYCCLPCGFALNVACVKKPPVLPKDHLNWHENTLALFPRHTSLPCNLCAFADSSYYWESELISLITQLISCEDDVLLLWVISSKAILLITQIISLVSSMDIDLQSKPESEFMSLITQTILVFNSMDLDSLPKPLSKFIPLLSLKISLDNSRCHFESTKLEEDLMELFEEMLALEPEPEVMSLIYKLFSLVIFMNSKSQKFITLCPKVLVTLEKGKFQVSEEAQWRANKKYACFPGEWLKLSCIEEGVTYFCCFGCDGKNHEESKQAPVEIKHHLHRKHSLQLVFFTGTRIRKCYCCDKDLLKVFYCCLSCDFSMNMNCAKKPPVLSIIHLKWHEHSLSLFPRHASLACNLCALADDSSPIYMCPNCDFVVDLRCINLPRVIRISRHHHRICFTSSFDQGDWSCGVCRAKIDNDYGGYSCSYDCCLYVAHSRCATQSNVWDGKELEGEAEELIEDVEPFVRISKGIIQHFTHQRHHLRFDENIDRDYDEDKQCEACHTPIYFGNFYSCMQCDFILHEVCANLSRKIYHPIHPHPLTLGEFFRKRSKRWLKCSACPTLYPSCIYYECSENKCNFRLHVKCATAHEPLVHESHKHPLFLTSKPEEERRICMVCNESRFVFEKETFNCIECDFSLCFRCATLPQKVRYKHDKHRLTLSYGDETTTTTYWCEVCEGKVNPKDRYYVCDEYCCVTLHIECLLGRDLYMKPAQSCPYLGYKVNVLPNNHHMSRPICSNCDKRCPHKTVLKSYGSIFCCSDCMSEYVSRISKLDRHFSGC